jgi:transcription antitermination factor NusG
MDNYANSGGTIVAVVSDKAAPIPPVEPTLQSCWFAVYTRSRHEKVVAQELAAKGIEHFLPLVSLRRRWSDRYVTIHEPLFPGYVMVRLSHRDHERRVAVLDCTGVVRFVGDGRDPWPVPDAEVLSVRTLVESHLEYSPYLYLKEGAHVEVVSGPLSGASGILVREPRKNRLVVSVFLFAQSVSVDVDMADVKPCDAWPSLGGRACVRA